MSTTDAEDPAFDDALPKTPYVDGGLNEGKTPIESFERAAELAASVRAKVSLAGAEWDRRFDEKRGPMRYAVHLWNSETQRSETVRYEEDLDSALRYVGRLKRSKPADH